MGWVKSSKSKRSEGCFRKDDPKLERENSSGSFVSANYATTINSIIRIILIVKIIVNIASTIASTTLIYIIIYGI